VWVCWKQRYSTPYIVDFQSHLFVFSVDELIIETIVTLGSIPESGIDFSLKEPPEPVTGMVIEPRAVEWEVVNREENHEAHMLNAKYCISAARKIGACVFLTPEDIVEVKSKMILTFVAGLWMADLVRLQPMVEGLHTGHFVFDGMKGK
jgi:hypothetical protein